MFLVVEALDGRLSFCVSAHFDESEPFATAGFPVLDYLSALHRTKLSEQLFELGVGDLVAKVPDIQLLAHRSSPVRGQLTRLSLSGSIGKGPVRTAQRVATAEESERPVAPTREPDKGT